MNTKKPNQNQPVPPKNKQKILICVLLLLVFLSFGASGFLFYQNYQLKQQLSQIQKSSLVTPSPKPTQKPTASVVPIPTETTQPESEIPADWKTYTNEEYGFEFRYPSDFIKKIELTSGNGITTPYWQEGFYKDTDQIRIQVNKLLDLNQFNKESRSEELSGASLLLESYKEIFIDSQKAIYYQTKNSIGQVESTIVEILTKNPEIYINIRQAGDKKPFFDQILSTLKFIE